VNNSLLGCTMEKMVNNDDFREIVVVNWDCRLDWLGCMMVKLGCTVGFEKQKYIRSVSRPMCLLNIFFTCGLPGVLYCGLPPAYEGLAGLYDGVVGLY
jgi:hypothetical protein